MVRMLAGIASALSCLFYTLSKSFAMTEYFFAIDAITK
jgi:hypothetical protein